MKTIKYILASLALAASLASCVKDLNVTPIDPNKNTADKAFTTVDDYNALLVSTPVMPLPATTVLTAILPSPVWTAV